MRRFLLAALLGFVCLSSVRAAPEPVRIGVLHSKTGTMASSELPLIDSVTLAVEEVNAAGGVLGGRLLEAVPADGASDPATFAREAERLIRQEGVQALFGCWTSACRKAVVPAVERHGSLLWYPLQYEGFESTTRVIYTGAAPNQQLLPAVDWARRKFGRRAWLVGSDYVFPRSANRLMKERLELLGGSVVGEAYRPLGARDFAPVARAISARRPDFILNTVNGDSNRALFEALRKAGVAKIPVLSFSVAEVELQQLKDDLPVGQYSAWSYFQSLDTRENRRFVEAFQARYGRDRVTDDPIEASYTGVHLYAKAVDRAGSTDPGKVLEAARGLIFEAPQGLIRIDPGNLHTWKVARIGKVTEDGQFQVVWSSELPLRPDPTPSAAEDLP